MNPQDKFRWSRIDVELDEQMQRRLRHDAKTAEGVRKKAERRERKRAVCFTCGMRGHYADKCQNGRIKHLKILGLKAHEDTETHIKAAYRRMALATHPDKNSSPEATDLFKAVGAAYHALTQP